MLSASYIRSLEGDSECLEALAYLAEYGRRYKTGGFTPPFTARKSAGRDTDFIALSIRVGRRSINGAGARVRSVDWCDGATSDAATGTDELIASQCADRLFTRARTGYLFVTSGKRRGALDTWLDSQGRQLLRLGFTLQPCLSAGGVSWCIVRRGKYKWTLTYFETMTGVVVNTGLLLATGADNSAGRPRNLAACLYSATSAVARLYAERFGVVIRPTVGMTAMDAARRTLPSGWRKWRPAPLLVAMERPGRGYRGGLTYAERYHGPSWRIDVTRQYTAMLGNELPHEWAFGRFPGFSDGRPGVYVCRVRIGAVMPYPLGVWSGPEAGFVHQYAAHGEYVCVLHTAEIAAINGAGGFVWPEYGYTATSTFSLASYVAKLQGVMTEFGRDSPEAQMTKPLGNYVYGKFGQNPRRTELLFSELHPGDEWYPYYDDLGRAWESIWERVVERYSASQHIDIAGTLTAYARAQTIQTWLSCLQSGARVVRCHTDSLTLDRPPPDGIISDERLIGGWRVENENADSIIVGANAYLDTDGVHIAGVTSPTYEMVDRMLDGQVVGVKQRVKTPRRGYERGEVDSERTVRATAR